MNCTVRTVVLTALLLVVAPLRARSNIPVKSGSFDSAGVKIAYIEAGKEENVILVHGLYSSAGVNWVLPGAIDELAAHYHVVALDLRGHGDSDKPSDEAAYGQKMVDDISRLMDHLDIPKAHIAGYSLGGIIVMKFIIDHPDRVISGNLGGMGWLRDGSFEQKIFEGMGKRGNNPARGTPPACPRSIAKLAVTEEQIKAIKVPLEILVGDHDPCRQMYVEPLRPVRPDWAVVIIDGAGHFNCIVKPQYKNSLAEWIGKNSK